MTRPENQQPLTFSDPAFAELVHTQHTAIREEHGAEEAGAPAETHEQKLTRLQEIAAEVARAANENPEVEAQKVPIYELQEKSRTRKFMKNGEPHTLTEATEGWVIVPPTADTVMRPPGVANLANGSGLGLVLTTDGKLYGCVARKGFKPAAERFTRINRTDIERRTFLPKEKYGRQPFPVPEKTLLPRYRAQESTAVPTLLKDPIDPENGLRRDYFTPYVVDQCYDALARFVATRLGDSEREGDEPAAAAESPDHPTDTLEMPTVHDEGAEAEPETEELRSDEDVREPARPEDRTPVAERHDRAAEEAETPGATPDFSPEVTSEIDQRLATLHTAGKSGREAFSALRHELNEELIGAHVKGGLKAQTAVYEKLQYLARKEREETLARIKERPRGGEGESTPLSDAARAALLKVLIESGAFRWTRQPEQSSQKRGFSSEVTSEIDSRMAALRAEGKSERAAYATLANEFHPDLAGGENTAQNEERIRYLNVLHEEATRKKKES